MRKMTLWTLAAPMALFLFGCASGTRDNADDKGQTKPPLAASLFKSDQDVLSDDAIARIMAGKFALPEKSRIAVTRFTQDEDDNKATRYYGHYYWRVEEYLKTRQEYLDAVATKLRASDRVSEVIVMPSMLTPNAPTIPLLREAAARLRADLLLVFKISGDTYYDYRLWWFPDDVKAYSTCEAVLLDTRSGTIPFATIVTEEKKDKKRSSDLTPVEAINRVEKEATVSALSEVGERLSGFLKTAPKTAPDKNGTR